MENECEALPGVAYPGVRDNRSTVNTKTGYDDDIDVFHILVFDWIGLAWFSSVSSEHLCILGLHGAVYI